MEIIGAALRVLVGWRAGLLAAAALIAGAVALHVATLAMVRGYEDAFARALTTQHGHMVVHLRGDAGPLRTRLQRIPFVEQVAQVAESAALLRSESGLVALSSVRRMAAADLRLAAARLAGERAAPEREGGWLSPALAARLGAYPGRRLAIADPAAPGSAPVDTAWRLPVEEVAIAGILGGGGLGELALLPWRAPPEDAAELRVWLDAPDALAAAASLREIAAEARAQEGVYEVADWREQFAGLLAAFEQERALTTFLLNAVLLLASAPLYWSLTAASLRPALLGGGGAWALQLAGMLAGLIGAVVGVLIGVVLAGRLDPAALSSELQGALPPAAFAAATPEGEDLVVAIAAALLFATLISLVAALRVGIAGPFADPLAEPR